MNYIPGIATSRLCLSVSWTWCAHQHLRLFYNDRTTTFQTIIIKSYHNCYTIYTMPRVTLRGPRVLGNRHFLFVNVFTWATQLEGAALLLCSKLVEVLCKGYLQHVLCKGYLHQTACTTVRKFINYNSKNGSGKNAFKPVIMSETSLRTSPTHPPPLLLLF